MLRMLADNSSDVEVQTLRLCSSSPGENQVVWVQQVGSFVTWIGSVYYQSCRNMEGLQPFSTVHVCTCVYCLYFFLVDPFGSFYVVSRSCSNTSWPRSVVNSGGSRRKLVTDLEFTGPASICQRAWDHMRSLSLEGVSFANAEKAGVNFWHFLDVQSGGRSSPHEVHRSFWLIRLFSPSRHFLVFAFSMNTFALIVSSSISLLQMLEPRALWMLQARVNFKGAEKSFF